MLDSLTGIPRAEDLLLSAIPVCGPYQVHGKGGGIGRQMTGVRAGRGCAAAAQRHPRVRAIPGAWQGLGGVGLAAR